MDHRNRLKLIDVPERRALAQPLELRKDAASGQLVMEGYAATWEPYDCYGGPERGGWVEQLDRRAMDRTLAENPDLMLLVNHEGLPLARTKSGNLFLSTDSRGLKMRALLDPNDPDVQRIAPKMQSTEARKPLLDEMSFSFRVKDQQWNDSFSHRMITELSLQKGDVSVVNYGMNPNTHAIMSTDAVGALASLSNEGLLEVRKMDRTQLLDALQTLQRAWRATGADDEDQDDDKDEGRATSSKPGGKLGGDDDEDDDRAYGNDGRGTMVNFDGSHLLYEGQCVTCANDRATGKYGNVKYADPGYLGPDGKQAHDGNGVKRYPIDEAHVQAAWSYINMPKNQKGYTAEQLASIKSKIKAAMKEHGHDVSEDKAVATAYVDVVPRMIDPGINNADVCAVEAVRSMTGGTTLVAVMSDGSRVPLPSFRQSGQFVSSPTPGAPIQGSGRGWAGPGYDWQPLGDNPDPHYAPYTTDAPQPGQTEVNPANMPALDTLHVAASPHAGDVPVPGPGDTGAGTFVPNFQNGSHLRAKGEEPDDEEPDDDEDDQRAMANPPQQVDDIHDDEDDVSGMGDEQITLNVDDRLRELRKEGELPDLPTLDQAAGYLRQLA